MTTPYLTPLGPEDLREAGIPAPWGFGLSDRVRFGEIDVLGHVNNAVYFKWFENLRIAYFHHLGLRSTDGLRPKMVLRSVTLDYLAEILPGDTYTLTGRTSAMRQSSFTMEQAVWVNGRMTTLGTAVMVALGPDNTKMPLPETLREVLIARDGARQD